MEVRRDTDCSYVFSFTETECASDDYKKQSESAGDIPQVEVKYIDTEVDHFRWQELADYFISLVKQIDSEGDFVLVEDFRATDGVTIGYTALRSEPLMVSEAICPPVDFPTFGPDFPECPYPELPASRPEPVSVTPVPVSTSPVAA